MTERVRVELQEFEGKALLGNQLGDAVRRALPVLLPPGYDGSGSRRYPVLYALAGFTGSGLGMLNWDAWQPNMPARLGRLYEEGLPHAIVVLPDCFTRLGGSQYVNSYAVGKYEDYVVEDVVGFIDSMYRTIPDAAGRGVLGKSSGGYGAFMLAMKHPDVFGAMACHSGDMYFELCYKPDFPKACSAINKAGGLESWWEAFNARVKKSGDDFDALNMLAMAACYSSSPNAGGFMGIELPFDLYTCQLKEDVWSRWLEHDPVMVAERHADNLRKLRLIYLDCGTRDEFNLQYGARIMSQLLKRLGIPHMHEEFDDGHMSVQYRYNSSIPQLLGALQTEG